MFITELRQWYFVIHLPHWNNSLCIPLCLHTFQWERAILQNRAEKILSRLHSVVSKMVLKVFFLLATLAVVSPPTCSATVQQQQQQQGELWDIFVCVQWDNWCCLLLAMLALVNPRATTLHCPNLSYATQLSSNVSAKLILTVWSHR